MPVFASGRPDAGSTVFQGGPQISTSTNPKNSGENAEMIGRERLSPELIICQCLFLTLSVVIAAAADAPSTAVMRVQTGAHEAFIVNGAPTFPIGFTSGPPTGSATPGGENAMRYLVSEGHVFQLWYCRNGAWGPEKEAELDALLREANQQGMHVVISIAELQHTKPGDTARIAELQRVVKKYRENPAVFFWKGEDEPQWGKIPADDLRTYYDTIHALDPNHPIWITQAPRGTVADWKPYSPFFDIGAVDIYPVSYPPGTHSGTDNHELSVVGDYAKRIAESTDFRKPTMMVLQICWSGVAKPGKTLRFPTFAEERYMTYQAVANGARGLVYFGGTVAPCLNDRDAAYGWNWTFYDRILRPVLDQLRPDSPLYPALIAPDSKLHVSSDAEGAMDYVVREAGDYVYLLASRREAATAPVTFKGLPLELEEGDVLFESPRRVKLSNGTLTDWFGPHEVHVYRFRRTSHSGS